MTIYNGISYYIINELKVNYITIKEIDGEMNFVFKYKDNSLITVEVPILYRHQRILRKLNSELYGKVATVNDYAKARVHGIMMPNVDSIEQDGLDIVITFLEGDPLTIACRDVTDANINYDYLMFTYYNNHLYEYLEGKVIHVISPGTHRPDLKIYDNYEDAIAVAQVGEVIMFGKITYNPGGNRIGLRAGIDVVFKDTTLVIDTYGKQIGKNEMVAFPKDIHTQAVFNNINMTAGGVANVFGNVTIKRNIEGLYKNLRDPTETTSAWQIVTSYIHTMPDTTINLAFKDILIYDEINKDFRFGGASYIENVYQPVVSCAFQNYAGVVRGVGRKVVSEYARLYDNDSGLIGNVVIDLTIGYVKRNKVGTQSFPSSEAYIEHYWRNSYIEEGDVPYDDSSSGFINSASCYYNHILCEMYMAKSSDVLYGSIGQEEELNASGNVYVQKIPRTTIGAISTGSFSISYYTENLKCYGNVDPIIYDFPMSKEAIEKFKDNIIYGDVNDISYYKIIDNTITVYNSDETTEEFIFDNYVQAVKQSDDYRFKNYDVLLSVCDKGGNPYFPNVNKILTVSVNGDELSIEFNEGTLVIEGYSVAHATRDKGYIEAFLTAKNIITDYVGNYKYLRADGSGDYLTLVDAAAGLLPTELLMVEPGVYGDALEIATFPANRKIYFQEGATYKGTIAYTSPIYIYGKGNIESEGTSINGDVITAGSIMSVVQCKDWKGGIRGTLNYNGYVKCRKQIPVGLNYNVPYDTDSSVVIDSDIAYMENKGLHDEIVFEPYNEIYNNIITLRNANIKLDGKRVFNIDGALIYGEYNLVNCRIRISQVDSDANVFYGKDLGSQQVVNAFKLIIDTPNYISNSKTPVVPDSVIFRFIGDCYSTSTPTQMNTIFEGLANVKTYEEIGGDYSQSSVDPNTVVAEPAEEPSHTELGEINTLYYVVNGSNIDMEMARVNNAEYYRVYKNGTLYDTKISEYDYDFKYSIPIGYGADTIQVSAYRYNENEIIEETALSNSIMFNGGYNPDDILYLKQHSESSADFYDLDNILINNIDTGVDTVEQYIDKLQATIFDTVLAESGSYSYNVNKTLQVENVSDILGNNHRIIKFKNHNLLLKITI